MPYSQKKDLEIFQFYTDNGNDLEQTLNKYNIKEKTFRNIKSRIKSARQIKFDVDRVNFERVDEKDSVELSLKSYELKTVDELLSYSKIDTDVWEPIKVVTNSWGSEKYPCFQIKVWLKKIETQKDINIDEVCENIIKKIGKYSVPSVIKRKKEKESLMWEVGLVDHHLGQLSWGKEVGFNYDLKIAKKLFEEAIDYLISTVDKYKIDKVLYHFGQDFYNVDSQFNKTAAGTVQDEESRWQKSFEEGVEIHVDAINKLKQIADVDAIQVSGNHDIERIQYAGSVIKAWFRNDKNVKIDNRPITRKYYRYGKNLIGFTHGKDIKLDRLLGLMPIEAKEDWGKCKNYEWKLGHIHSNHIKKTLTEKNGIIVKNLPTLASVDAWHFSKGYLHNRETQSFLWHKEKGNIIQTNYRV